MQVEKEVHKAMRTMGELEAELGLKKEASRKAKGLQVRTPAVMHLWHPSRQLRAPDS